LIAIYNTFGPTNKGCEFCDYRGAHPSCGIKCEKLVERASWILDFKGTIPLPLHGVMEILGVFFPQYWMMANYEVLFKRHLSVIKTWFIITKGAKSVIFYVFGFANVIFQINNKK